MRLSERSIKKSLPPHPEQAELSDDAVRGLSLRGNRRVASWTLRRTIKGQRHRAVLGSWPAMSAEAARAAARALAADWTATGRPRGRAASAGTTVSDAWAAWAEAHSHWRRTDQRHRALRQAFASLLS